MSFLVGESARKRICEGHFHTFTYMYVFLTEEVQSVRRPTVLDKTGQTLLFNPSFAAIFLRSRYYIMTTWSSHQRVEDD